MRHCILDIETTDLDPKVGRIICIGIKDIFSNEIIVFHDENERTMVEEFLNYFHEKQFKEIIGYNVLFDIRFIFAKCLKYKIYSNGFFRASYTDLMLTMKSVKHVYSFNKPGTLGEWSEYLFGESKLETGECVPELFANNEIQRILDYNKKDVELTYQLWKRVQEVMG